MKRDALWTIALIGALGFGITACDGRGEDAPMGDMHGDMPMGEHMEGMPGMEGMMQRHAQEADSMASALREHVGHMRQLPAEEWYDRMGEHVSQVSAMLRLMSRQMREMDMGMGMDDEAMGGMMGMTGEEHRRMMDDMQSLRADVERLQTASPEDVRQRMPDHLDRLEDMVITMERSAEAMGRT